MEHGAGVVNMLKGYTRHSLTSGLRQTFHAADLGTGCKILGSFLLAVTNKLLGKERSHDWESMQCSREQKRSNYPRRELANL
jgi:hypothetical protein